MSLPHIVFTGAFAVVVVVGGGGVAVVVVVVVVAPLRDLNGQGRHTCNSRFGGAPLGVAAGVGVPTAGVVAPPL